MRIMAGHSRANSVLNGELKKQSPDSALNSLPLAYLQCGHAGDAILPLRWQGDYSLTYNPSAFRLVDFVLFLLVLSKALPYIG
jgi:hypothetical protein